MKKVFVLIALLSLTVFNFNPAFADDEKEENKCVETQCEENVCPVEKTSTAEEIQYAKNLESVKDFIANFEKVQNKHNINGLKKFYTDDFVNADGYNKTQLFNLIENSFKNYPNIKNTYDIKDIIIQNNFATVFLNHDVEATTNAPSKITGDIGEYKAKLKTVAYLKKFNNTWKIYAENVNYEFSTLAYGSAKGVNALVDAPNKVFAGNDYCAGVEINIPEGYNAIASINSTQLVDGFNLAGESFRQISTDNPTLERILKANTSNNNEAVVISIGFTKQDNDMFKKPKIELSGLLMLMQRVDIIPANSNAKEKQEK